MSLVAEFSIMRRANALLLAFLMATVSLAGCLGGGEDDGLGEEPAETLDEWMVYLVDSGDNLPNCNSDTLGRLYYVADVDTFEVCLTTGWSFINIKGADGAQGPAGETGPQGEPGMDGQPANESMMYNLEQQLLTMNQDMSVILMNISEIENDLGGVDNTIQLYYSWFTQINTDVINIESNLSLVWDAILTLESNLANATSCQLARYAYCAGADLSYMNLSGIDLTGIDLRGANLQNTTLDNVILDGADLRSIFAINATFINASMKYTFLQNAEFNSINFIECGGSCGAANLTNVDLQYADLTNAFLQDADLTNAYLYNADLTNANLRYADLTDADLAFAYLTDAILRNADLTDAHLIRAKLTYANLRYADLTNTLFSSADLTNADFYGATVYDTVFGGTTWSNTIWIDGIAYDTNQA